MFNDTIYALSTPVGNGVAVVRISGGECKRILRECFSYKGEYTSHMLYYGNILDGDRAIDEGMAVLFEPPRSYTAELCAELHCHGSYAGIKLVLAALSKLGLRQAEPGEFTRRAFLNGRLELSQAEAVMDFIHATAEQGAKAALDQLQGSLCRAVGALQDSLTDVIAQIEAGIDYPEEDWEGDIVQAIAPTLEGLEGSIDDLINGADQGVILRDGLKIALVGKPNTGKSSLLNALSGEQKAIVTDIPGTTRDVIEVQLDWCGVPVLLLDTAGLRESDEAVERIGVGLTRKAIASADLVLALFDSSKAFDEEDEQVVKELHGANAIAVLSKSDLPPMLGADELKGTFDEVICASSVADGGLREIKQAVRARFDALAPANPPMALVTNRRHLDALQTAKAALATARAGLGSIDLDCLSIDLKQAWDNLGKISGQTVDEAIIDRIFSKFCLGK